MRFKRVVFWAHLGTGVAAGLFIFLMSVTGVLLTYEHEMVAAAERRDRVEVAPGVAPLGANELAAIAYRSAPRAAGGSLVFEADRAEPVAVTAGRETVLLLNPYTGATIDSAASGYERFFQSMERLHRWLGARPDGNGATLLRAANLLFLFLIASGIYIWLPDAWRWPAVRFRMLFERRPVNGKMRDFNWHHVFSFWALIPLFVIVLSGVVISYGWANNLVYAAFGEQAPRRGGPPGAAGEAAGAARPSSGMPRGNLNALLAAARAQAGDWRRITLPMSDGGEQVQINIERSGEAGSAARQVLVLRAADAGVLSLANARVGGPPQMGGPPQARAADSAAGRARRWFRFVHTGQQYGIVGKTVAGLASLAACFLVYTGLALAYRRLIRPLLRRA